MKSILANIILFGLFGVPNLTFALEKTVTSNIYASAQGNIDLDKLENLVSQKASGAKVEITSVRWSRNPLKYGAYFAGGIASYVLDFKIADSHVAKCELKLFLADQQFMINRCESATANVRNVGTIGAFTELGLPEKPKF